MLDKTKTNKVMIVSGPGGHFTLALAVAEKFKNQEIIFVVPTNYKKKSKILCGNKTYTTPIIKNTGKPINPAVLLCNFIKSLYIALKERPKTIINTGSSVGYFTCLFGRLFGAKIIAVEANDRLVPSKGIKMISKFASEIWLPQKELKKYYPQEKIKITNLILPKKIYKTKPYNLKKLSLDTRKKTLFVTTGYLGSKKITETVIALVNTNKFNMNLIMNSGEAMDPLEISKKIKNKKINHYIKKYINIDKFYGIAKASDIVITRAGLNPYAMLILKKPMIIIPLEKSADDHQKKTAKKFKKEKSAEVILEKNLNTKVLEKAIEKTLKK